MAPAPAWGVRGANFPAVGTRIVAIRLWRANLLCLTAVALLLNSVLETPADAGDNSWALPPLAGCLTAWYAYFQVIALRAPAWSGYQISFNGAGPLAVCFGGFGGDGFFFGPRGGGALMGGGFGEIPILLVQAGPTLLERNWQHLRG